MGQALEIDANFPEKLAFLFRPARYKVVYGGRGKGATWGFARAGLIEGTTKPLSFLCARELQNSIQESVHKVLKQQIFKLGMGDFYQVLQSQIRGVNGTEFNFEGIRNNVDKIRSYEGVDRCWVAEAKNVSKYSWEVLVPTIRKDNSEIWVDFNPELESDETYQRFVKNKYKLKDLQVVKMSWRDNPYFPSVLYDEMMALKESDPLSYLTVWEGECRHVVDGAVYTNELTKCRLENRITHVPFDPAFPCQVFFDLGYSDMTALWAVQRIGFELRIIDYYENRLKGWDHYLQWLQGSGYNFSLIGLPHDAAAKSVGSKRTIEEQTRALFPGKVRIIKKVSITDGHAAVRSILPACYFDAERCEVGLNRLSHYKYEVKDGQFSKNPLHDDNSHGADAFRYLAVGLRAPKGEEESPIIAANKGTLERLQSVFSDIGRPSQNWMGW